MTKPIIKLKITASRLYSLTVAFPASTNANTVRINTTGKTTNKCFTDFPKRKAPNIAVTNTKINCSKSFIKFVGSKTVATSSAELLHEKLGTGATIPESARNMVAIPKMTTTQSSVNVNDLEDVI